MAVTVASIDTAIEAILDGGQSFTLDGITYTKANLSALISLRDNIQSGRTASTRPLFRAFNFGSMGYGSSDNEIKPTPVLYGS